MTKNIFTLIAFGFLFSSNSFAKRALYLSAQPNESNIIEHIYSRDEHKYKIEFFVYKTPNDRDFVSRIVDESELSFTTESEINGHRVGGRALVLNSATSQLEQCQINFIFENGYASLFCDLPIMIEGVLFKEKTIRHNFIDSSEKFIPQVDGSIGGVKQNDILILTKAAGLIKANSKVLVRYLFKNGKILVIENTDKFKQNSFGNLTWDKFQNNALGPALTNAISVLVDAADLQPIPQDRK